MAGRAISSLLFGRCRTGCLTFVVVPLLLIAVATTACYFAARYALKIDPIWLCSVDEVIRGGAGPNGAVPDWASPGDWIINKAHKPRVVRPPLTSNNSGPNSGIGRLRRGAWR